MTGEAASENSRQTLDWLTTSPPLQPGKYVTVNADVNGGWARCYKESRKANTSELDQIPCEARRKLNDFTIILVLTVNYFSFTPLFPTVPAE